MKLTKYEATKLSTNKGVPVMSSLQIAELTNKEHKNILKDIRKMLIDLDKTEGTFSLEYIATNKKPNIFFALPEREFTILITGYSTKLRANLYDNWQKALQTPQNSYSSNLSCTNKKSSILKTSTKTPQNSYSSNMLSTDNEDNKLETLKILASQILQQNDRLLNIMEATLLPEPTDTLIISETTKLSDLVGLKSKTASKALKFIGQ